MSMFLILFYSYLMFLFVSYIIMFDILIFSIFSFLKVDSDIKFMFVSVSYKMLKWNYLFSDMDKVKFFSFLSFGGNLFCSIVLIFSVNVIFFQSGSFFFLDIMSFSDFVYIGICRIVLMNKMLMCSFFSMFKNFSNWLSSFFFCSFCGKGSGD